MRTAGAPVEPDRLDLTVFGRPVSVLLPPARDQELWNHLHVAWSRCAGDDRAASPAPSATDGQAEEPLVCDVRASASLLEGPGGRARLGDSVTTAVTTRAMESVLGRYLLLHAAGLADADGRVVALCAPPGTGKTTATRILGRAFGYVTDETVAVDPRTGQVLPYPKPLQIIDASANSRKVAVGPDALGLREPVDPGALRLGPVLVLDRSLDLEDEKGPRIERLPLLEALPLIVAQTSSLHLLERPLQTLCALMDAGGGPWVLRYSEAETLPALLERWLTRDAVEGAGSDRWAPLSEELPEAATSPVTPATPAPPPHDAPPARLVRADVHDAVRISDAVAVLRGAELVVLRGIGATLWEQLARPRSLPELTAGLVGEHGPVTDAAAITARLVDRLVTQGLLEPVPVSGSTMR